MGCRDGFKGAGIVVKIAFVIVSISMFCNWLAFCTASWARLTTNSVDRFQGFGLWRSTSGQLDGIGSTKFGVVQAFGIVGFMCQNIGYWLLLSFIFNSKYKGNSEIRLGSAVLLVFSAIGWLIAVAIFGAEVKEFKNIVIPTAAGDAGSEHLHYSYALAVCACGHGLLGGILMFLGGRGQGQGSVGTK